MRPSCLIRPGSDGGHAKATAGCRAVASVNCWNARNAPPSGGATTAVWFGCVIAEAYQCCLERARRTSRRAAALCCLERARRTSRRAAA